jgi:CheY-like chemotaxis protein
LSTSAIRRPVVLIVEDEFLQRMNAAEMIGDAGFNVVEAGNADEAIAILEGRPDVRVVFTDIQMPGSMDGLKLAQFVTAHCAGALLTSLATALGPGSRRGPCVGAMLTLLRMPSFAPPLLRSSGAN